MDWLSFLEAEEREMKIVFMGSPDFAVPSLEALVENRFEVSLVVTQPDRRAGRGRKMLPTAVKATAQSHGIPVMAFGKGDRKVVTEAILAEKPDAVVVWRLVISFVSPCFRHHLWDASMCTPACCRAGGESRRCSMP